MTVVPEARRFTPEQATQMLPLVRRIVEDIVLAVRRWRDRVREFELVTATATSTEPDPRALTLERETSTIAEEIDRFVRELTSLGIEIKDYETGLVDFPAERDGRPVYLCWRLGEPSVQFWHEIDAGFVGRRPLEERVVA
jgi:hypothetical protein